MHLEYFSPFGQVALALAQLCLYGLAGVLIHELGHAAAAILFGFKILAVRVGPFDFKRQETAQWTFNQGSWSYGFVRAQFRRIPGPWAAPRCFAFFLGGPVANLCVAVLLAPISAYEGLIGRVCGYLMIACCLLGLASLVPAKTKLGATDGANLLKIVLSRKMREETIFRFSFLTRINEIRSLVSGHNSQEAKDKLDELIVRCSKSPNVKPELTEHLTKLRDVLEKALTESGTSNVTTELVQG